MNLLISKSVSWVAIAKYCPRVFGQFAKNNKKKKFFFSSIEFIYQVMSRMGITATQEEAAELFALVDTDRDGRISVAEFAKYIGGGC